MKRIVSLLLILTLVFTFAACDNGGTTEAGGADGMTPGTYTGEGDGFGGPIKVEVTVGDNGEVTDVNVVEHAETAGIGDTAIETYNTAVVENNGTDGVEATSGATMTWEGYKTAVDAALDQAR